MAFPGNIVKTVLAGATASFGCPVKSDSTPCYTFQVILSGAASVAIQGTLDDPTQAQANWTTLTGLSAINANAIVTFEGNLNGVKYVVTGGTSATITLQLPNP